MKDTITPERNAVRDLCGVLLIDKPQEFTSFDLCAKLRGMLKTKRIGHAGTLDPMATGVMTVLLGNATRAAELLPNHDKRYTAGFRLGVTTDTLDITGAVTGENGAAVTRGQLEKVLGDFRGKIEQLPPMYSAVHADGRRLYQLARQGVEVEREAREISIYRLELLSYNGERREGVLDVSCSKGTYIRALTDDIGKALGCGAVLTSLRRTEAAGFSLGEALTLEEVQRLRDNGTIAEKLIPVDRALKAYRSCYVTPAQAKRYYNGGELSLERLYGFNDGGLPYVRVYGALEEDGGNIFLGIGRVDPEQQALCPYKRFS